MSIASISRARRQAAGDGGQVGGEHAPADPAAEARIAFVPTPPEGTSPFQSADPSLDAGPKPLGLPKPVLVFVLPPRRGARPRLGQGDLLDPEQPGRGFVLGRVYPAIAREQVRRAAEEALMLRQGRRELLIVRGVAVQDAIAADDPAVDLVQPDFAPEFRRAINLPPTDDLGVRLEKADELGGGRHALAAEDAPSGL